MIPGARGDRPRKCFNPGCNKLRSRRRSQFRGRRDVEEEIYLEVNGTEPDAQIDDSQPIEVHCQRQKNEQIVLKVD